MASGDLIVAQISDTHIGSLVEDAADTNQARLERVLDHLAAMTRRPDLLLVTGDLADAEGEEPYRILRERLERSAIPFHVLPGNHDLRHPMRQVFGGGEDGFFHTAVDAGPLRILLIDTLEEGRHGGAFCEARSAWLRDRLAEAPDRPTLIALHHPPIDTGIDWLTTAPGEPWLTRLDDAIAGRRQVVALVAGHIHRPIASVRNGVPVHVCPSVASPISVDLAPLDPAAPDGRILAVAGPPGFALHLWRDGVLTTHFDYIADQKVLARFDPRLQPPIAKMFAERP